MEELLVDIVLRSPAKSGSGLDPTKHKFHHDCESKPTSLWNQRMWLLFWDDFLRIGYAQEADKPLVKKAYDAHVKTQRKSRRHFTSLAEKRKFNSIRSQRTRVADVSCFHKIIVVDGDVDVYWAIAL